MSGLHPLRCRALSVLWLFVFCPVANAERLPSAASAPGALVRSQPGRAVPTDERQHDARGSHRRCVLSVAITDLRDGTRYARHADHVFAVASTIKLAILRLFRQADSRGCSLSDLLPVPTTALIEGSPILGGLLPAGTGSPTTAPRPFSLRGACGLHDRDSDNTATNALIDRLGFAAPSAICVSGWAWERHACADGC